MALVFVIGYLRAGLRTAAIATASILLMGLCGFWDKTMVTLSIMLVAVALAMLIGIPLGIWSGLSDNVERRLRPLLDTAQVMPAYVYLIPCVAFFGIGVPAAVVATLIYAVPPAVRLTSLGAAPGPGRVDRGRQIVRRHGPTAARQGAAAAGAADGSARPQPGDHDGLRHRRDRLADRYRRCRRRGVARPAEARCQPGLLGRVLHRVRGDRPRPHHDRRTQHEARPSGDHVDGRSTYAVDRRARHGGGRRASPPR